MAKKPTRQELEARVASLEAHERLSWLRHNVIPEGTCWSGQWSGGVVTVSMKHYRNVTWPGGDGGAVEITVSTSAPGMSVEVFTYTELRDRLNNGTYRAPWRYTLANLLETQIFPEEHYR